MKKMVLTLLLSVSVFGIWANDVPTLLILTTGSNEVQIPVASVQKITYDESGTTMYVHTLTSGTQSYAVTDVSKMTLCNVPAPTALTQLTEWSDQSLTKIEKDGVVYVVKDGKVYSMEGGLVK